MVKENADRGSMVKATFDEKDFLLISDAQTELTMNIMGQAMTIPCVTHNYINSENTVGYSRFEAAGKNAFAFLSKIASGDALTLTGTSPGNLPFEIEGTRVRNVMEGSDVSLMYAEHVLNLGSDEPVADRSYLNEATPKLPQRTIEIGVMMVNKMMEAMGGLEGMLQKMGEALGQMMGGMGGEGCEGGGEGAGGCAGCQGCNTMGDERDADTDGLGPECAGTGEPVTGSEPATEASRNGITVKVESGGDMKTGDGASVAGFSSFKVTASNSAGAKRTVNGRIILKDASGASVGEGTVYLEVPAGETVSTELFVKHDSPGASHGIVIDNVYDF